MRARRVHGQAGDQEEAAERKEESGERLACCLCESEAVPVVLELSPAKQRERGVR